MFFPTFKIKKIKILYCNFIATFNLHALVKINEFYLLKLNS